MTQNPIVVRHGEAEALNALGGEVRFLCRTKDTDGAWSLMENLIPRGVGPGPHVHAWGEGYYLLSGEVEFEIEGQTILARAGDFLYAPGGARHAFRGASDEPAHMLIFDAPAHSEAFFRELDRQIREMPRDAEKAFAIGAAHGIHFAPAPVA